MGFQKKIERKFKGRVVSDVMDKTIVVRVDRKRWHPLYKKQYTVTKRYKVHDPKNTHHVGESVTFVECRPLSREKRWRVVEVSSHVNASTQS
ncbi:MAG: 30S ribosomal protein S17 [Candidatus Kerfeldbacteria bacterium RIFCSPHIGHO2_02_FULL_42_14]|uniref:Small ribosomal subunit protein uS17 n=1 Tax=Candidatus Kerfeldbacteria bacterium RIFCSPHIGHO2_02_FULL_42_14 TaxID=1798540 RepID=A0A1G2ASZ7_9BACT|nr:MAG: 30S ribosomal protein S17 [Candidatus Kerfeldbacteria bacterium RIFCSPHIGHO2_02_FULL_42_14]OGY80419.1 MAG: 30S ribosomal protein S17 [Candidatus Kerfeldbacteria bacterium RIFCSPHIGHO2_12_FULL_42_13]OGY83849.1 MAG: 30S ribosomal protein S17 [Candidatus Kerfeldbacteria bacterium RIFCSPLOWO2_02_FULL_42_19]OGY85306.1 MAG: 30S ribosomal protein S17 [Candidatus Kerfeldbacteria bacterium RIFCSPLOWO2_12_FULL_43_9]